jgi:hypothetical protein
MGTPSPTPVTPKRPLGASRRPVTRVDSIREDEEERDGSTTVSAAQPQAPFVRPRQTSLHPTTTPIRDPPQDAQPVLTDPPPRTRSFSASASLMPRRGPGSPTPPMPPVSGMPMKGSRPVPSQIKTSMSDPVGMPKRKHKVAQNLEAMDLDDIMGGDSDDEAPDVSSKPAETTPRRKGPTVPKAGYVSKDTQDLINFLSEGPPDADIPVLPRTASAATFETPKTKTGRLQRMVSKLTSKGSVERLPRSAEDLRSPHRMAGPPPMAYPTPPKPSSLSSVSKVSLQNVTVVTRPPRPPYMAPLSPPSSPSQVSSEDLTVASPSSVQPQRELSRRKAVPKWQPSDDEASSPAKMSMNGRGRSGTMPPSDTLLPAVEITVPSVPPPRLQPSPAASSRDDASVAISETVPIKETASDSGAAPSTHRSKEKRPSPSIATPTRSATPVSIQSPNAEPEQRTKPTAPATTASVPSPPIDHTPSPSQQDVDSLRKMLAKATTADECRLLVDIFLARSALMPASADADADVPYPSPSPSLIRQKPAAPRSPSPNTENDLQSAVVGFLLADA